MTTAGPPPADPYGEYLPAVLRADPSLMRLVAGLGRVVHRLQGDVEAVGHCAVPDLARDDFLPWLAGWVGMALRADWDVTTQRRFVAEAVSLHRWRGTAAGLRRILRIHLGASRESVVAIHDGFPGAPHFFEVSVDLPVTDRASYARAVEIIRQIVEMEKPAHTYYALRVRTPSRPLVLGGGTGETVAFVLGDPTTPPLGGGI